MDKRERIENEKTHNHTAGPWRICPHEPRCIQTADGKEAIASVTLKGSFYPHVESANARLIASAPELLGALEGLISSVGPAKPFLDRARTAIAKARGVGEEPTTTRQVRAAERADAEAHNATAHEEGRQQERGELVQCDVCGDESNSEAGLVCGRTYRFQGNQVTCSGTYQEVNA